MIGRLVKAAARGVRAELSYGHSGWQVLRGAPEELSRFGRTSQAGTHVSPETIMQLSTVWACVSTTAQTIASLPAHMYRKDASDSRERVDNDLSDILTISPNAEQTALEFWQGIVAQMLIRGNGIAERELIGNRLVGLRPLLTAEPERLADGRMRYAVTDRGKTEYLPAEKVFHLRGFGIGNGVGMSVVRYGVQSLGAALAAETASASMFANGMQAGGMISFKGEHGLPNAEQTAGLQSLVDRFSGSSKAGKTLVLPPHAHYEQLTMNPEDAQLLETRRFSVEDICRWFKMPPIVIGHSADGQTMWGSGVEEILLSWRRLGLNPLLTSIEKRVLKDLIGYQSRRSTYFEFNREAILEMDSEAKARVLATLGASGTMSANERRKLLNLPRVDDPNADALLAQTALAPLKDLGGQE